MMDTLTPAEKKQVKAVRFRLTAAPITHEERMVIRRLAHVIPQRSCPVKARRFITWLLSRPIGALLCDDQRLRMWTIVWRMRRQFPYDAWLVDEAMKHVPYQIRERYR